MGKELNFSHRVWYEQYELKSNFDRLLIIFFIRQIHRVRFVFVNGEASRVKPSKKKKISRWKKNFEKKILGKKFEKKICEKKCWKINFEKKNFGNKYWKKSFGKKILKKKCSKKIWQKNFRKINSKTKIFITKPYSDIDKRHTIFALLSPFDKTGWKTGSYENFCGIWFKIGNVARSHWTQGMRRFERSREKRYMYISYVDGYTYVRFNLTVRIAEALFDLAIWQFFLCYEENMRFSALITISTFQARNFCSSLHRRWELQKTLSIKQKM